MITLIILFGSFLTLVFLSRTGLIFKDKSYRSLATYAMAAFLIFFGLSHFYKQNELILMLPEFIPFPEFIVFITGIIEIVLAIGLIYPASRKLSGILLAIYFIAVLPANIYKALHTIEITGTLSNQTMSWVRIFFQPIFIVWALYVSKEDKPLKQHPKNISLENSEIELNSNNRQT
ncbi:MULTISPECIES: DoxX family protein [Bacillaceae]|uniref:DoxX family protein n=1 Tax=Bacillaceae TaxID=186817 RepID=UPI0012EEB9D1|nr:MULTISPECIES: DoxX family protein [Bacillaceae]MBO1005055.1 DoxX family protein [Pseudogracilibacillus auburnensis]MCG5105392.1 DoxX family protein [Oceanobacillus alkalisoli]